MIINNPVHNFEVEQQVIGLLIKDPLHTNSREALDSLCETEFYTRVHGIIFKTIKLMHEHKKSISIILLETDMDLLGIEYGGFSYLATLQKDSTSISNMASYVSIVKQCSISRELQHTIVSANEMLNNNNQSEDVIEYLGNELKGITTNSNGKELRHLKLIEGEWLDDLQAAADRGGAIAGLCTGIDILDQTLNGIDNESLVVIAGSPSMGKTLFCQTIAKNIGVDRGENVMFFSMEMSEKALYSRFISGIGNIPAHNLKSGRLDKEMLGRVEKAITDIRNSGIYITDEPKQSVGQIRAKVRRYKIKHPNLSAIFIDYLGLMKLGKADRHDIAIGNITRDLKELCKELCVPIFLCVQSKRPQNIKDRPNMSSLKDSSCIEADADLVLFVHRQEIIEPETTMKGITELVIAKDRHNDANGTLYLEKINGAFVGLSAAEAGKIENERNSQPSQKKGFTYKT